VIHSGGRPGRRVREGDDMATQHIRDVELPYPYPVVLDAIARSAATAGIKVNTVDPARGMVFAVRSVSALSWGENVTIQLGQSTPTSPTQLRITSALAFGLVDWGRNRKNVDALLAALTAFLDQYAAASRLA
jgi:hypothetical protein